MSTSSNPADERRDAERDLPGFLLAAVRREHPEWLTQDGQCPPCEEYKQKLARIFAWPQQVHAAA